MNQQQRGVRSLVASCIHVALAVLFAQPATLGAQPVSEESTPPPQYAEQPSGLSPAVDESALQNASELPQDNSELDDISESAEDLVELSLEQLLDVETTVASWTTKSLRETPGVVTIVTRDEIVSSGARDLIDVLRLVPGFSFGTDVEGVVGLAFRGNWGHEGKILLIIDGQRVNETLYGTTQLGNHYPVDQIERIEVIRGPGSAVYGGYAELAVIKVTTRGAKELDGFAASGVYGQMSGDYARRNLSLAFGQNVPGIEGLSFSASGFVGQGHRSDRTFTDFAGDSYNLTQHELNPMLLNLGATYRDLNLRFIFDNYQTTMRDAFDANLPSATSIGFRSYLASVDYAWRVTDKLTLRPELRLQIFQPWRSSVRTLGDVDFVDLGLYYVATGRRVSTQLTADYAFTDHLNIMVGAQLFVDGATKLVDSGTPDDIDFTSVSYTNIATFSEVSFDNPIANVVGGLRYEDHSAFGRSVVPRLALTRTFGRFHLKALYSNAFRAPAIQNIQFNEDIQPERTTVYELEAGYQLGDHMFVRTNGYDISIKKPIIYFYDSVTQDEGYANFGRTGSRGVELEYRIMYPWLRTTLTYSFYTAAGKNDAERYEVEGHDGSHLGAPNHKATLSTAAYVDDFTVSPTLAITSPVYGYVRGDAMGNAALGRTGTNVQLNMYVDYKLPWVSGLRAGAGVFNILDDKDNLFVQPYNGSHGPIADYSREFLARLSYEQKL